MRKSIVKVGYAPITSTSGTDTYGPVVKFESDVSGGREFTAEANGDTGELRADGVTVYSYEQNNGYNCKLTLLDLIDDVQEAWLGNTVDTENHTVAEYAKDIMRPRFALLIAESTTDGTGKLTVYYNCQVSKRPGVTSKTTDDKFDPQFPTFEINARPRLSDYLVKYETTGATIPDAVPEPATT